MRDRVQKVFIYAILFVAIMIGAFYLALLAQESEFIRNLVFRFGYLGIFVVALITGFNVAVPIPAVAFFPLFLESGLQFWGVIITLSIGLAAADAIGYFLGRLGREIAMTSGEKRILGTLEKIRERYVNAPLYLLFVVASLAPLPNELLVIPMAFMGYRLRIMLPILLAGHLIFNTLYAFGISSIFDLFV